MRVLVCVLCRYMMAGDIVAYYISLPTGFDDSTSAAGQGVDTQTRIEYLDRSGLRPTSPTR
jgi:hypothetical protein